MESTLACWILLRFFVLCAKELLSLKQVDILAESTEHDTYRSKRKDYSSLLHMFLNQLECDRARKLRAVSESDEKLFWKLLKGRKSTTQMRAFLVSVVLLQMKMTSATYGLIIMKLWTPKRPTPTLKTILRFVFVSMLRISSRPSLVILSRFLTRR